MFPLIKDILAMNPDSGELRVRGWVRTKREMKNLVFVEVNDGSCLANLQCTFDGIPVPAGLSTGASVEITGRLVASPAQGQTVELAASALRVVGGAPAEDVPADGAAGNGGTGNAVRAYPLQKKRHSLEFLREMPHLRGRTNTIGAVMRVRSALAFAVHSFFRERGFLYLHTPIITGNDAEGAGAMFRVTAQGPAETAKAAKDGAETAAEFFGRESFLTVSGQLEAETYATALSRVYSFGPTFRAEHSNTARHLAEFWMIEPEAAFFTLSDNMALAEAFLKYLFSAVLEECGNDLCFFDTRVEKGIIDNLKSVIDSRFTHMTYTRAVAELEKANQSFEYKPYWGCDMQSEHEKYLTEKVAGGPVIVTDYPREIKAFYMKQNGDGKTVRAMDVLVPRLGEIIGGSEREDDPGVLQNRMAELGMNAESYDWYLDLRRYGSVPHSGFGLGFERLVQYVTGMANIRDVIPYPRAAGQLY
ncbi:MAG: asparagine--tRNA ligase [Treponema sp.]|jgi:asparaginyl-tRNA synthetase|nr:asparagine--tRNA ligase [Treponema sp.]